MGRILEVVAKFLAADDWAYTLVEGRTAYKTAFEGRHGHFACYAQERPEQAQFVFYSVFPVRVPADQLADAAEFITRANYGLVIGNFEMDFTDGEVRYKTSVDVEGIDLAEPLVRHLIYANVLTMDKYLPGLLRVLYGELTPLEALTEVENGS